MTPLFYVLFVGLAVYLFTLPASGAGYQYIFVLDPKGLLDPVVWIYALGQAFFSLSVAGNGTLIYGSYLSRSSNVPSDARMVAVFDTVAALLAALVIIPAMAVAGQQLDQSGPGLMFIYLPNVLSTIPGGWLILILFFAAVIFAALTSLVNLFEAPTATLQELFHLKRPAAAAITGGAGILVGLVIAPIVDPWMNICSIYICPLGALLRRSCSSGSRQAVRGGAGEPGPDQALRPLVLSPGKVPVLRGHPGSAHSGLRDGRHRLTAASLSTVPVTAGPVLTGPGRFLPILPQTLRLY